MAIVNMKCDGYLNGVKKSGSIKVQFRDPNFTLEWGEIFKSPLLPKEATFIDESRAMGFARWKGLAKLGKMFKVTKALAKSGIIENTNAGDPDSFETLSKIKQKRSVKQIFEGKVELPILASYGRDYKWLVAGNTRLTAMMKIFGEGYVWQYDVPEEQRIGRMFPKIRGDKRWPVN